MQCYSNLETNFSIHLSSQISSTFEAYLDKALIDPLIFKITEKSVNIILLSIEKLSFEEAYRVALQHETIKRDSALFYARLYH